MPAPSSSLLPPVVAVATALLAAGPIDGHDIITSRFDYHNDVLPILERHCLRCHGKDGSAPFSLRSYQEARPRAVAIKEQVLLDTMPPWFARTGPLELDDESRLSAREIDILMEWASGGAPIGKRSTVGTAGPSAPATPRNRVATVPVAGDGPPSLVIELPEVVVTPGDSGTSRRVTLRSELRERSHLRAWKLSTSRPDILRGVDVYRDDRLTADAFLGSRLATDPPIIYGADTTAILEPGAELTLVVVAVRPDHGGRGDARAQARLELWLADRPGERRLRGALIATRAPELSPQDVLLGVRPRAGFRLRDSTGSSLLEFRATPPQWPRTYLLRTPFATGGLSDVSRDDPRQDADLGLWLLSSPRSP